MSRFVVLLRGINVGGHNKVPMAELRDALGRPEHRFDAISTYIQSGNIVLDAPEHNEAEVVTTVHDVVADRFGLDIAVVARAAQTWPDILGANPFPEAEADPKRLHVLLCDEQPDGARLAEFDPSGYEPDRFRADGRQLYVCYDRGAGTSKLTGALLERKLGVRATARNWATMLTLSEMLSRTV